MASQMWIMLLTIPFALVLGFQGGLRKSRKKRLTYKATQGIKYLRETFEDLNPATVSLLMDLSIDHKKDINATLLRMYHKGSIGFDDKKINLIDENRCTEPCERELFEILKSGRISQDSMYQWGENRKSETVQRGFLAKAKMGKGLRVLRNCCSCCCVALLLWFVIYFASGMLVLYRMRGGSWYLDPTDPRWEGLYRVFTVARDGPSNAVDAILDEFLLRDSYFTQQELAEFNDYLRAVIVVLAIILAMFFIPPFLVLKAISQEISYDGLERTPEGHRRTEEVAALQRFIRDFGDFSQSEKEHVILWDDFLVFAIVLEENDIIVRDISNISKNGIRDMELVNWANSQYEPQGFK